MSSSPIDNANHHLHDSQPSTLLRFPPELILEIISYLPLAAHLIFRLQVCRALRNNEPSSGLHCRKDCAPAVATHLPRSLNLGPLLLSPPHRFSFPHWLNARDELIRLGLVASAKEEERRCYGSALGSSTELREVTVPSHSLLGTTSFDWHKGIHCNLGDTGRHVGLKSVEAVAVASRVNTTKSAVQQKSDTGPAYEVRMLRRILGFLNLVDANGALPPTWALPLWAEAAAGIPPAPRLRSDLAPWTWRSEGDQGEEDCCKGDRNTLRTLSLVTWSGISGREVVSLLQSQPAFDNVRVILKTDRLDEADSLGADRLYFWAEAWDDLEPCDKLHHTSDQEANHLEAPNGAKRAIRAPPPVPGERERPMGLDQVIAAPSDPDGLLHLPPFQMQISKNQVWQAPSPSYVETQVVVNVGSRLPAGASLRIKGHGLSAGYRAFCYVALSSSSPSSSSSSTSSSSCTASSPIDNDDRGKETGQVQQDDESQSQSPAVHHHPSASARPRPRSERRRRRRKDLHLIFQGRFRLEEAIEIEEMLTWSHVRCSACRSLLEL